MQHIEARRIRLWVTLQGASLEEFDPMRLAWRSGAD